MLFDDVCTLYSEAIIIDQLNQEIRTRDAEREIFCNKKSIGASEFYQAAANDFKPEIMIETPPENYGGEKVLEYGNVKYEIYRTYTRKDTKAGEDVTELYCKSKAGV